MADKLEVRLAVMETKFDDLQHNLEDHMDREEAERQAILGELATLAKLISELRDDLNRYKSFIGGILWTVSALFAGAMALWKYLSSSS